MRYVKATSIGSAARDALKRCTLGSVHSVFERTFNVLIGGELIGIGRSDVARSPTNVITDIPSSAKMSSLGIRKNDEVLTAGNSLEIGGWLRISLDGAEIWRPRRRVAKPLEVELIKNNLSTAEEFANSGHYRDGLGQLLFYIDDVVFGTAAEDPQLNPVVRSALPHILSLLRAVESKDLDLVRQSAEKLAGLGPGLSPSSDDMLAGFMSSLRWTISSLGGNPAYIDEVNQAILVSTTGRTTLLSQQLLGHATAGEVNETVEGLLETILAGKPSEVRAATEEVLAMGETSGVDTMVGILLGSRLGLKIFTNKS
ncbi:MAG: DUF2877 domain-containing protein [Candidatus Hodarchaeaceae archaeon]|nr:DUF2877 domain-containing protein [Candidatus Hodarchaeaceae archaeon]